MHVPHLAQGAKTDDPPPLCSDSPFPMLFEQLLTLQAQFTQKGEAIDTRPLYKKTFAISTKYAVTQGN